MSVLWLTPLLVAVTCRMYVPAGVSAVVVNEMGELASPPVGGVTVSGTKTAMPVGALPTQDTANDTGALNSPSEFTMILVPLDNPGVVETVSAEGVIEKSSLFSIVPGVFPIMTGIWVELETAPQVAVTKSV